MAYSVDAEECGKWGQTSHHPLSWWPRPPRRYWWATVRAAVLWRILVPRLGRQQVLQLLSKECWGLWGAILLLQGGEGGSSATNLSTLSTQSPAIYHHAHHNNIHPHGPLGACLDHQHPLPCYYIQLDDLPSPHCRGPHLHPHPSWNSEQNFTVLHFPWRRCLSINVEPQFCNCHRCFLSQECLFWSHLLWWLLSVVTMVHFLSRDLFSIVLIMCDFCYQQDKINTQCGFGIRNKLLVKLSNITELRSCNHRNNSLN